MTRWATLSVATRVVMAALAGAIAGIHLDLWSSYGYQHIPTIGPLFLLNGIGGALLALACLAIPSRAAPLVWLAVAGYAASTLVGLIISLNGGLFGFTESTSAPLFSPAVAVEAAAVLGGCGAFASRVLARSRD